VSINSPTVNGATPAYAAALRGNIEILKLLHVEGADLTAPDDNGITPLRAAMWHRHIECFEFLLSVDEVLAKINFMDKHGTNVLW
jgi:ankyrin repeat protein